jgi:hypothetical protein
VHKAKSQSEIKRRTGNADKRQRCASFETNPRVPNAKDFSRPQAVFIEPLAINERAARTVAIREHCLFVDQDHLAVQHGNVGVFQPRRGTHVAADEEQLLFLELENTAAVPTGDYSKLVAHRGVLQKEIAKAMAATT